MLRYESYLNKLIFYHCKFHLSSGVILNNINLHPELSKKLFTEDRLLQRVRELGEQITRDYLGEEVVVIGLLKGASMFTVDLVREIQLPILMDWFAVSTYGLGSTPGEPRMLKDVDLELAGRNVLIVEDILDTGRTLHWLLERLKKSSPKTLNCCVLLRKPHAVVKAVSPRYVGFDIEENWIAGYGIDYAERHRNLREIYEVRLPVVD
jgi:hypoxanthine phosphoribosyltransferase